MLAGDDNERSIAVAFGRKRYEGGVESRAIGVLNDVYHSPGV
jgi:hypothetical protein